MVGFSLHSQAGTQKGADRCWPGPGTSCIHLTIPAHPWACIYVVNSYLGLHIFIVGLSTAGETQ